MGWIFYQRPSRIESWGIGCNLFHIRYLRMLFKYADRNSGDFFRAREFGLGQFHNPQALSPGGHGQLPVARQEDHLARQTCVDVQGARQVNCVDGPQPLPLRHSRCRFDERIDGVELEAGEETLPGRCEPLAEVRPTCVSARDSRRDLDNEKCTGSVAYLLTQEVHRESVAGLPLVQRFDEGAGVPKVHLPSRSRRSRSDNPAPFFPGRHRFGRRGPIRPSRTIRPSRNQRSARASSSARPATSSPIRTN